MRPSCGSACMTGCTDFNSHTPHGVRQLFLNLCLRLFNFNSHTPHGVRPESEIDFVVPLMDFNSHTPHGVRLTDFKQSAELGHHFNSHTPHGVRPLLVSSAVLIFGFQLTHPTRGATSIRVMFWDNG